MNKKIVKLLSIVFIFTLLFSVSTISNAKELELTVSKTDYLYNKKANNPREVFNIGETVKFTVNWENALMQAAGFTLQYDAERLLFKATSLEEDFYSIDSENGIINVEWTSLDEIDKTNIDFSFEVIGKGTAVVEVTNVTAFANGDLQIPETYNLSNAASSLLGVLMGDANGDGTVTEEDATLLTAYINHEATVGGAATICDVNLDQIVNQLDVDLISKSISDGIKLPVVYGDVYKDGKISIKDVARMQQIASGNYEYTLDEVMSADINVDGKVDSDDINILMTMLSVDDGFYFPVIYGDVNQDGIVDNKDLTRMQSYIDNSGEGFNIGQTLSADLNLDNKVDQEDRDILMSYLAGEIDKLPVRESILKLTEKDIGDTGIPGYAGVAPVAEGITRASFINTYVNQSPDYTVEIKNSAGEEIADDGIVGTGTRIFVKEEEQEANEIGRLIIYGDVNGDGLINPVDALAVIKHINNKILFTDPIFVKAGKTVNTPTTELTAVDALGIIKHANGKYVINQNR